MPKLEIGPRKGTDGRGALHAARSGGATRRGQFASDYESRSPEFQGFPGQVRPPGVSRILRQGRKA